MTTADHFLQAILDNPDDDAVRLIYADWLDEHDDQGGAARAEFIRVQCALAGRAPPEERRHLVERERQLLRAHETEWLAPVRHIIHEGAFRRGFLTWARLPIRSLLTHAEELFRLAPVRDVRVTAGDQSPYECRLLMPQLADCPPLTRLRSLDLSNDLLDSDAVEALAVSECLPGLDDLDLSGNHIGDAGVRAMVSSALFRGLSRLDLHDNRIGPGGARALLAEMRLLESAGRKPPLQELDLRGNALGAAGARAIRSSPLLARVTRL